ncbi:acyltransferase [Vibrio harveyi]
MKAVLRKMLNLLLKWYFDSTYQNYKKVYNLKDIGFFKGRWIELYGEGSINIGEGSYCGNYCAFQVSKGYNIYIGRNVAISHNVRIYTKNRSSDKIVKNKKAILDSSGDVRIGNDVWIGANVFIVEGITIGDNVVIGANAVVTKNIPSNSVAVGVPARVIKN